MANDAHQPQPPQDEDRDQVDFTWASNLVRRVGRHVSPSGKARDVTTTASSNVVASTPGTEKVPAMAGAVTGEASPAATEVQRPVPRVRAMQGILRSIGRQPPPHQLTLFECPGPTQEHRFPSVQIAHVQRYWSSEQDRRPVVTDPWARLLTIAAVATYVFLFARWTLRNYDGFGIQAFDFGIYDQGLWLLSRFKSPFVTVMGRQLFGDHTSFILLPLVPFYWIFGTGKVLLIAQATALGLGGVPIFLIAREKLRHEMLAAMLTVAFLVYPALGWTNFEQFHPDVFEVPLLLFALWFMLKERWLAFAVCVGALLLVKEDVAPLVIVLGLYVAYHYDRRVGLLTGGAALAYMAAALWWILPALNGVGSLNGWRIPFGSPMGVLRTAVLHPGDLLDYLFADNRPWYVWQLFAPFTFLSLLAPSLLVLALPPLALNVLSNFGYQHDIHYHYQTLLIPVLAASMIFAIARARSMSLRYVLVVVVLFSSLLCARLWGPTNLGITPPPVADPNYPTFVQVRAALKMIPPKAVLSTFYGYLPHADHRTQVYMFPNPFHASYWGTFKQEGKRLPQADNVEYILLPTLLDPEPKGILDSIRSEFDTVYQTETVILLRRKTA